MGKKAYGDNAEGETRLAPTELPDVVESGDPETAFPASENVPGQAESRDAYGRLVERLKSLMDEDAELPGWTEEYLKLRSEGLDWRKAIYVAWAASPAMARIPKTLKELATDVLGLKTDRSIRKWRENDPKLDERIAKLQAEPLFTYRADFYRALAYMAATPDPKCHQDRKLAFEMLGDYTPRGKVDGDVRIEFDEEARKHWEEHASAQLAAAGATMALFTDTPEATPETPDDEDEDG